jgi:membrane protein YdbS with pleckstrin-like domain
LYVDIPLSSSVILVVAVALWIVWVAPYVLRNRRHQFQAAGDLTVETVDAETANPQAGRVAHMTAQQEKRMDTRKSSESAAGFTPARSGGQPAAKDGGAFRIRYGRTAIALAGLLSVITAVVSGVLRIFGIGNPWLPALAFLTGAAAVVLLRRLAVRDRRKKMNAAFSAAMGSRAESSTRTERYSDPVPSGEGAVQRENMLFDAVAVAPRPKPLTARELREAALAVAVAAGDNSAAQAASEPAAAEDTSWEPVEVPKPTYVEAAKADRPAPEPLDLPESPKAVGKPSLKQGPAAAPAVAAPNAGPARPLTKAQSALSNLDDVLQRRRA